MNHELTDQYETAIWLLSQLQGYYSLTRKELQEIGSHSGERETLAAEQLRTTLAAIETISANREGRVRVCLPRERQNLLFAPECVVSQPMALELTPTIQICCLGGFQVSVGWNIIERWRSIKAKSLLKYLVAQQGQSVSKDALMESLWPGCEPSLASNNLKAAVHALRQTLSLAHGTGDNFAWVLFHDGNYRINPEVDMCVDVEQFDYHWRVGRQSEKKGKLAEALQEYETAESLYKGDYFEDDLYEVWTSLRREALKDAYVAILGRLADYAMQTADYEGCIVYCQRILAKDECREDAYRRLMCCHSRLEQRNRAIRWYRLCEKTIRSELDVCPDHHTVELYQKLLNDEYI